MNLQDWESVSEADYGDFMIEEEAMIRRERRRKTDEADGYFSPKEDE
jgi:hypothetical protein